MQYRITPLLHKDNLQQPLWLNKLTLVEGTVNFCCDISELHFNMSGRLAIQLVRRVCVRSSRPTHPTTPLIVRAIFSVPQDVQPIRCAAAHVRQIHMISGVRDGQIIPSAPQTIRRYINQPATDRQPIGTPSLQPQWNGIESLFNPLILRNYLSSWYGLTWRSGCYGLFRR